MIGGELAFGYLRVNGPDDPRLRRFRTDIERFGELAGLRLVNVFHDFDPEQADTGWLGFAHLLNVLYRRPSSALVIPDVTHLGIDQVARHVNSTCIAVSKARLWVVRQPARRSVPAASVVSVTIGARTDRAGCEVSPWT